MRRKIVSGLGQAQYFISRDDYSRQFLQKLDFVPFPCTLNVLLEEPLRLAGHHDRELPGRGMQLWRASVHMRRVLGLGRS
jgi:CTP-dependent riboflavin kinase